jgi:hypothetical protein
MRSCAVVGRKILGVYSTAHRAPRVCAVGAKRSNRGGRRLLCELTTGLLIWQRRSGFLGRYDGGVSAPPGSLHAIILERSSTINTKVPTESQMPFSNHETQTRKVTPIPAAKVVFCHTQVIG